MMIRGPLFQSCLVPPNPKSPTGCARVSYRQRVSCWKFCFTRAIHCFIDHTREDGKQTKSVLEWQQPRPDLILPHLIDQLQTKDQWNKSIIRAQKQSNPVARASKSQCPSKFKAPYSFEDILSEANADDQIHGRFKRASASNILIFHIFFDRFILPIQRKGKLRLPELRRRFSLRTYEIKIAFINDIRSKALTWDYWHLMVITFVNASSHWRWCKTFLLH